MKDIQFYLWGFWNTKGLAIIHDFTAHWAIKNEQMVNIWKFDLVRMQDLSKFDSDIDLNFQTFAICLIFMSQFAVKS